MHPMFQSAESIHWPQCPINEEPIGGSCLPILNTPTFNAFIQDAIHFCYQFPRQIANFCEANPFCELLGIEISGFLIIYFLIFGSFRRPWIAMFRQCEKASALCISTILHTLYHWTHDPIFLEFEIKIARMAHKHKMLTLWAMYSPSLWIHWVFIMLISTNDRWQRMQDNTSWEFFFFYAAWLVNVAPFSLLVGFCGGGLCELRYTHPHPQYTWQQRCQLISQDLDVLVSHDMKPKLQIHLWKKIYRFQRSLLEKQVSRSLSRYSVSQKHLKKRIDSDLGDLVLEYVFAPPVLAVANHERLNRKLDALEEQYGKQELLISVWTPFKPRYPNRAISAWIPRDYNDLVPTARGQTVKFCCSDGKRPKGEEHLHRMCYFCHNCRQFHSFQDIQHCDG